MRLNNPYRFDRDTLGQFKATYKGGTLSAIIHHFITGNVYYRGSLCDCPKEYDALRVCHFTEIGDKLHVAVSIN